MDLQTARDKIRKIIEEAMGTAGTTIVPQPPMVLVYVLPKAGEYKKDEVHLWLPDQQQNKPVHEGLVVTPYPGFWSHVRDEDGKWRKSSWEFLLKFGNSDPVFNPEELIIGIYHRCPVQKGDHVLFSHYEGVPVPLDGAIGDFRLIKEDAILARLDYTKESTEEWLRKKLDGLGIRVTDPETVSKWILDWAVVIKKDVEPKTMSGV